MILRGSAIYGAGPGYVHLFAESLMESSIRIGFSKTESE